MFYVYLRISLVYLDSKDTVQFSIYYFLEAIYILKHGPMTEMPPFKITRRNKQASFKCIILGLDISLNIHLRCYSFCLEMSHHRLCPGQK